MNKPVNFDAACGRRNPFLKACEDLFWEKDNEGKLIRKRGFAGVLFVGLPKMIDRVTRHVDHGIGRSYNGVLQRLFMDGHSLVPMLFILFAILFAMLGPTPRFRGWPAVTSMFIAVAVYWLFVRIVLAKRGDGRELLLFQIFVIAVLTAVFWLPAGHAPEALPAPYRNLFAPIMLLLLALAFVADRVACWVMRGFPNTDRALFAELLRHTELFVWPVEPEWSLRRILHGLINAPLYHPLHLLLMPALPLILIPPEFVRLTGVGGLVTAWLILLFAGMYDRLNLLINVARHLFFIGGQLVVSLVIIGLAIARVLNVDYVTTMLDAAPAHTIAYYVLASYTAFWLYEYWLNRALTERMLPLLRPESSDTRERMTWLEYNIDESAVSTKVLANHRAVEVFSGDRLAVTGAYVDTNNGNITTCGAWHPYDRTELFERLAQSARALANWTPDKKGKSAISAAEIAAAEIGKRTKLYFNLMNVLLVGVLAGAGLLLHHFNPQRAGAVGYRIEGREAVEKQPVRLEQLVFGRRDADNKVILLAASGGGTRAALYTASVLRGIAALGRLDQVVLVSGVSGGSAALAYFAIHRDELLKQAPGACTVEELKRIESGESLIADAWCVYIATMARSYIEDVLRGASELDVAMSKSFGHLLDESFMRRFGVRKGRREMLGSINDLGVILNTTISGHPASDSAWLGGLYRDKPVPKPPHNYSVGAGGRLVFTNLRDVSAFPRPSQALAHAQDEYLRYVIVGGHLTAVTSAAALSANFPPVFSNGGVDVRAGPTDNGDGQRYWVTDGGAADNRGAIELLYAVESMLDDCANRPECQGSPPEIHIIVADASAVTIDYRSDRGGGSILGAANKFSSQLMIELIKRVEEKYDRFSKRRLVAHFLPMPAVLRMRGGLGTHWMMPQTVTLKDICEPKSKKASEIDVERLPLIAMIVGLHARPAAPPPWATEECRSDRPNTASAWLAADRHPHAWRNIVSALPARQ